MSARQIEPGVTRNVIRVGLDRRAFLSRGYSQAQLGSADPGVSGGKAGVFLSMFHALQQGHPSDAGHPWFEWVEQKHRGLGAVVDAYAKAAYGSGKNFHILAYDSDRDGEVDLLVTARNANQEPFNAKADCESGIVCASPRWKRLYVRADANWALGERLDRPYLRATTGPGFEMNLTHAIAHGMAHFLGLPHVGASGSILYSGEDDSRNPSWAEPEKEMDQLLRRLAAFIFG